MFRHRGKARTSAHNTKIASLLSFVAGLVNVAGFLSVKRLTTNVTGHFAFFVDEMYRLDFWQALVYFLFILFFFFGSFVSSTLIELMSLRNERYIYIVPASIEIIILLYLGLQGSTQVLRHPDVVACSLLFAMGLQNSLVTSISNAHVRTTHLTGLFTDMGIECSQLFFFRHPDQRKKLTSSIRLRIIIISFFFTGGITAGILYARLGLQVLIIGALALAGGLMYDSLRLKLILLKRKVSSGKSEYDNVH